MIAIVDYGSGNVQAIGNIYRRLNTPFLIASDPQQLLLADRLILPGVGAFDQAMTELERSGLRLALDECVIHHRKPLLGICVGMQLLAERSEEGRLAGLGWIHGVVSRFDHAKFRHSTHLPHMGWNTVSPLRESPLFEGVDLRTGYYFLHSYFLSCWEKDDELAVTEYGVQFTSVVNKGNIYGVQFHPEKSHNAGIQLLKNFSTLVG